MADNTVNVYIVGHNQLSSATDQAGASLSRLGQRMDSVGRSMTRGITLPVVAGFALAAREANEAAKATAQTEAVIKSTGGAANVSAKQVSELADSLAKKTAIDDETIQSGENLLLTFKNIKNEAGKGNDIFDQTTRAMLDMSVAMGQDTKSSAIQLGKALNDPIKGLTALTRVGVTFNEQQKEQIKTLVESGDTLAAQKIILKEVMSEFGGSAAAAVTPFDKLKMKMEETAEEVGTKLMPVLVRLGDVVVKIADAFLALPEWAQTFILGGAAVAAATGPLLQFSAAALKATSAITNISSGLGAWGAALGVVGGALAVGAIAANEFRTGALDPLKTATDDARRAEMGLTDAIREQGSVLGETTRKWIEHNAFQGEAGKNLLNLLASANVSLGQVEQALLKGGPAWDNMTARLASAAQTAGLTESQLLAVVTKLLTLQAGAQGAEQRVRDLDVVLGSPHHMEVTHNLFDVTSAIQNLLGQINAIPRSKQIDIVVNTPGSALNGVLGGRTP